MTDIIDKDGFNALILACEQSAREIGNCIHAGTNAETSDARLQVRRTRLDIAINETFAESEAVPPDQLRALLDEFQDKAQRNQLGRQTEDDDWSHEKAFQEVQSRLLRAVDDLFLEHAMNEFEL